MDELKPPAPIMQGGSNGGLQSASVSLERVPEHQQFTPSNSLLANTPADLLSDPVQIHVVNILNYDKMLGVLSEQKRTLEHRRSIIDNEISSVDNQTSTILDMKREEMELVNNRLGFAGSQVKQEQPIEPPEKKLEDVKPNKEKEKDNDKDKEKDKEKEKEKEKKKISRKRKSFKWEDEIPSEEEEIESAPEENENEKRIITSNPLRFSKSDKKEWREMSE